MLKLKLKRIALVGVLTLLIVLAGSSAPGLAGSRGGPLTLETRIEYQLRLERLAHDQRVAQVPEPKPRFEDAMPAAAVRAKVERYLALSAALETFWQRPLTVEQLQAEMDRMARDTKQPERLREMFAALDDDPFVIAECLARPLLAERLVRNWYASDDRWHGDLRNKVHAAAAALPAGGGLDALGGEYAVTVWRRGTEPRDRHDDGARAAAAGDRTVWLDDQEWAEQTAGLRAELGVAKDAPLRPNVRGAVQESASGFVVHAVLGVEEDGLRVASVAWPKRSFDAWWDGEQATLRSVAGRQAGLEADRSDSFAAPAIAGDGCTEPDTWRPTPPEFPESRSGHTAVWTGTEMVVWGGYGGGMELNSGARYSPATDTWAPMSQGANAPTARQGHTAVWTGTVMVVWGGRAGSGSYVNSGARYSPATDSWVQTSKGANVPAGRAGHTAVWTGDAMVVWGGYDLAGLLNSGGLYSPSGDTWVPTSLGANVPSARKGHTAVWTGKEMVVWGGSADDPEIGEQFLISGGRYSPKKDRWEPTSQGANVPVAREGHTAVWTGKEMVIWGGGIRDDNYVRIGLDSGGRYSPNTDRWAPTSRGANVAQGRFRHTAVWTGKEMVVWGGVTDEFEFPALLNTGGRYSPSNDRWVPTSQGANVPTARQGHTAVWTGAEMVVWGGWTEPMVVGSERVNSGARYALATDSWVPTSQGANVPIARRSHTAVWTGTEMVVWGGIQGFRLSPVRDVSVNSGSRYAPATDSWLPTSVGANVPEPRGGHTAVWTGTEMVVWGGDGSVGILNSGGRYSPATDGWVPTSEGANVPAARYAHTAVWTGTEMVVWGGATIRDGSTRVNSGGRYSPVTDTWLPTSEGANVPAGRIGYTAVWTGTEMVVWGGNGSDGTLNNGGRYSPATDSWAPTSQGENVPMARGGHTAVWTGTEMVVWGGSGDGYLTSGGRYTPLTDSWVPTSESANVPAGRVGYTAVWTGTEMVVWGGNGSDGTLDNGGRYSPATDSWVPTSQGENVPMARGGHTAVWTGTEMVVWGGGSFLNSGGRYCTDGPSPLEGGIPSP